VNEKDLLGLLVEDGFYKEHEDRLVDDIIVMFIAGMETIQISTTNLVQHLTAKPDLQKRLIEETESYLVGAEREGIVAGLTSEITENFNFTRNCFYESLRLDPPTSVSGAACFLQDVKIGNVTFP
jgi:cytochrome P450